MFEQERMEAESADTIVGINAPVDLAGRTPLAWSVRSRARNKQVRRSMRWDPMGWDGINC